MFVVGMFEIWTSLGTAVVDYNLGFVYGSGHWLDIETCDEYNNK